MAQKPTIKIGSHKRGRPTSQQSIKIDESIREYLILQLYSFIQIRKKLVHELIKIGNRQLDKSLSPFWKKVLEHENAISELRNSYFAHIQEKTGIIIHIQEIVDKHQFPSGIGDLLLYASCVIHYVHYLYKNLPDETISSNKKYEAIAPVYISNSKFNRATFGAEIIKLDNESRINLKKNGLKY